MIDANPPLYPGQIFYLKPTIIWAGPAYEHLYAILSDGRTFRLDKILDGTNNRREWTLVAEIPFMVGTE